PQFTPCPYTTLFRSLDVGRVVWKRPKELLMPKDAQQEEQNESAQCPAITQLPASKWSSEDFLTMFCFDGPHHWFIAASLAIAMRSAEHTSELHSRFD